MTGVIATIPKFQFSSSTGVPLALGTLTVYLANTTTPTDTWQDSALSTLNTNPVQLDSSGSCVLWLDSTKSYKFILKNAAGAIQWTQDNITGNDGLLRRDLAASSGSSLVGYLPAGTGAVATTVQAKLRDSVSVKDFGAVGDGVTDDATAIINAQNSLTAGGTLYFHPGTYMVGKTIPFKRGVRYVGASAYSTTLKATAASWDNILGYAYPTTVGDITQHQDILIENITFDGNKSARTENQNKLNGTVTGTFVGGETITSSSGGVSKVAVWDVAGTFVGIDPAFTTGTFLVGNTVTGSTSGAHFVIASKSSDDAWQINVRAQTLKNSTIRNCRFINSYFTALSLYSGCEQVTVSNNYFVNNNQSGTVLSSPYTIFIESYAYDINVDNNYIIGSLGSGIVMRGGVQRGNKVTDNVILSPGNYGVELSSNATDIISDATITGNTVYGSSAEGVVVWGNTQTIYGVVVANNTLDTCPEAIGLRGNLQNVTVTGNTIKDCAAGLISHGVPLTTIRWSANTVYGSTAVATPETGIGYRFPTTPVPSSDVNTLDEYTEYTSASTACTGAITTSTTWKLTKIGNVVTLYLPSVQGAGVALTYFTFGEAIPAAYRPQANMASVSALVTNNGVNQATPGMVFVDSGSGIIYIARDGAYSASFTVTAQAGLGQATSISWVTA